MSARFKLFLLLDLIVVSAAGLAAWWYVDTAFPPHSVRVAAYLKPQGCEKLDMSGPGSSVTKQCLVPQYRREDKRGFLGHFYRIDNDLYELYSRDYDGKVEVRAVVRDYFYQ